MRYILSGLFLLSTVLLCAQNVTVSVECPNPVRVGETFQVTVRIDGDAETSEPEFTESDAFSVLAQTGQGGSSSSFFDGRKNVTKVQMAYTFMVQAKKEGTQQFGPAEVIVGNKKIRSAPVNVQVLAGNQPAQASQGSSGVVVQPDNSQVRTDNRDIFAEILVDRKQVYRGEYITATLKLFTKVNISSFNVKNMPAFEGFYRQDLETPQLHRLQQETINGVKYGTGVIARFILSPQKEGLLDIGSVDMVVGIDKPVRFGFGYMTQTVPQELRTTPVNITVLPLPGEKPASFTGGVGQMKMETTVDKTELKANDPVTLKVTVSGSGNIKFVDPPRINFPPDFEVYDPKVSTNLNAATTGGNKTFEYLIIPRHGGTYKIPSVEFAWFDPQAKQYKTSRSQEYTLTVERGEEQPGTTIIGGITREDVKYLGKDIRYIKTGDLKLHRPDDNFFGTWKFWLWYLIPALAFAAIVYLRRKYIRKYSDKALVKNKKANRYAAKRLKQARGFKDKGQNEQFYEELSRALWGYLSDKLNIPVAELSKDSAKAAMERHKTDAASADEFIGVIDDCEFARYAPAAASSDMNALYNRAAEAINKMQKVML